MESKKDEFVESITKPMQKRKGCHPWQIIRQAVEVPIFLTFFSITVAGAPINNLTMYRACVHSLNYTREECQSFLNTSSIDHSIELEKEVQKYATNVKTVEAVIKAVGPAILALFMGVWSDKHGRKPLILWPLLGMTISAAMTLVWGMLESLGPWWLLVPAVPYSFGGSSILVIGAFCYASDVTTQENRSLRILVLTVSIAIAISVGGVITPHLLRAVGNNWFLFLLTIMNASGFLFVFFCIKESLTEATQGTILSVFNLEHPKEMMRCCFMKKPNYVRAIVLFTGSASCLSIFTECGLNALTYMYTRTKIQWSMTQYTNFSSISAAWSLSGAIIGIGVLQKLLKINDLSFICFSFLMCAIEFFIKAFATTSWHMYLGSGVALFGATAIPLLRSFLSKAAPRTEMAKVFGLLGVGESFCPLLAPLVYNELYTRTIATFPGAIMILTACVNLACLTLSLIVFRLKRKVDSRKEVKLGES